MAYKFKGNVDLHISTNMRAAHFYQKTYPATGAIDGIIPYVINTHCVHLSKTCGISINWWSDQEDKYKIYNITIYARKVGTFYRFVRFYFLFIVTSMRCINVFVPTACITR